MSVEINRSSKSRVIFKPGDVIYSKWLQLKMEVGGDEKFEENIRYSFLLGCALRNDDIEHFFQVYDAIVPKQLCVKQIEEIKEEARRIAELPEDKFNNLAFRARDLSLARGLDMDEQTDAVRSVSQAVASDYGSLTDTYSNRVTLNSVSRTSRHLAPSLSSGNGDDSGVFDDSRTVISNMSDCDVVQSNVDPEVEDVENGRPGSFDYYHSYDCRTTNSKDHTSIQIEDEFDIARPRKYRGQIIKNDVYDEAYKADSDSTDTTPRSDEICSPRSDVSTETGTEMKTFKLAANHHDDTDDSIESVNVHERLYRNNHPNYTEMQYEDDEDVYEFDETRYTASNFSPKFNSCRTYRPPANHVSHYSDHREVDVDSAIAFRQLNKEDSNYRQPLSASSQRSYGTTIQKTEYSKQAPFGNPVNQSRVFESAHKLIDSTNMAKHDIPDMPRAEPISDDAESAGTENHKKKKKKKKQLKDEAGSESSESSQGSKDQSSYDLSSESDQNGNPIPSKNQVNKRYPFSTYNSGSGSFSTYGGSSKFPKTFGDLDQYDIQNTPIRNMREPPGTFSSNSDHQERLAKMQKRKEARKAKDSKTIIPAEKIEGNRGNANMDELLDFIQGGSEKKKNKITNQQKDSLDTKKKKDKKSKELQNSVVKKEQGSKTSSDTGSETAEEQKMGDLIDSKPKDTAVEYVATKIDNSEKFKPKPTKVESDRNKSIWSDEVSSNNKVKDATDNTGSSVEANSSNNIAAQLYIFTDTGIPKFPAEEEFQEVITKKKKKVTQLHGHKEPVKETTPRIEQVKTPRRPTPRSATPPPVPVAEKPKAEPRDLSPSAFPALGGREGRRNSTGDVPRNRLPIQQQDDSDLESVKSLPADKSHSISYAQIAASPKPKDQNDLQLTGSNERRHSLDSADKTENSTNEEEFELKTRSQELPTSTPNLETHSNVRKNLEGQYDRKSKTSLRDANQKYSEKDKQHDALIHWAASNENIAPSYTTNADQIVDTVQTSFQGFEMNIKTDVHKERNLKSSSKKSKYQESIALEKKGVIFLGRNNEACFSNLGISFGFDNDEDDDIQDMKTPNNNAMPRNGLIVASTQGYQTVLHTSDVNKEQPQIVSTTCGIQFKQTTELSLLETDRGNFNLEEVITQLTKEWDRVMDFQRKNPKKVLVIPST